MNFIKLSALPHRKRVILESPYADSTGEGLQKNITYARRCLHHSIRNGEAPIASHLLYTQPGVLDDLDPEERQLGIDCGLAWLPICDLHVFYTDNGWSKGMLAAYNKSFNLIPIEIRALYSAPFLPTHDQIAELTGISEMEAAIDDRLSELDRAITNLHESLKLDFLPHDQTKG